MACLKLLIDECLTPELARYAMGQGIEAQHVNWLGLTGAKDWDLIETIEAGDWTFATRNSVDFRGPAHRPGPPGQYSRLEYHNGLICLNGPAGMSRVIQLDYFQLAIKEIASSPDLLNQIVEVTGNASGAGLPLVTRYEFPLIQQVG